MMLVLLVNHLLGNLQLLHALDDERLFAVTFRYFTLDFDTAVGGLEEFFVGKKYFGEKDEFKGAGSVGQLHECHFVAFFGQDFLEAINDPPESDLGLILKFRQIIRQGRGVVLQYFGIF